MNEVSPLKNPQVKTVLTAGRPIQSLGTIQKKFMTKRQFIFSAVFLLTASSAFAQGNGMAGITEATGMVTSYFEPPNSSTLSVR